MRRKDISIGMEVAVVRGESWSPSFGIVESTEAERRVYHGSRDFRGSIVKDGIAVRVHRDGRPSEQVLVVPCNQVKDVDEVMERERAKAARVAAARDLRNSSHDRAHAAVAALAERGITAEVKAEYKHGDMKYGISHYRVVMSPSTAEEILNRLAV